MSDLCRRTYRFAKQEQNAEEKRKYVCGKNDFFYCPSGKNRTLKISETHTPRQSACRAGKIAIKIRWWWIMHLHNYWGRRRGSKSSENDVILLLFPTRSRIADKTFRYGPTFTVDPNRIIRFFFVWYYHVGSLFY